MNIEEIIHPEELQKAIEELNYNCHSPSKALGNIGAIFIPSFERQIIIRTNSGPIIKFYSDFNCKLRVKHLAMYSKKQRVRKKNINRMLKAYKEGARL